MSEVLTVHEQSRVVPTRPALWWPGVALSAGGAIAASLVAGAARAAGAPLEVAGEAIPLFAFAQLAFIFSLLGVVLAAACRRYSRRPVGVFLRMTFALVVLSFIPDLLTPDIDAASRVALICSHIAVAAVVIPGLEARLRQAS
ncbi:hypothetical protein GCM10011492_16610 [Flexivirga endophytica]|uniref:Cell envelope biogenesis protein OmpA n=1 Tax=Flexivirga endophytica TaxID=1849103 RepID=A0A916T0V7_9MICO|nr:DUF6069 family protein [Flexivirga endophytica]GGB26989.1 hypothetical protein GCM10011492_16610 [Flexivirga endophytica]GHB55471.1 hypothetical protein GCM10008112_25920 [Flexivirga endophytica]